MLTKFAFLFTFVGRSTGGGDYGTTILAYHEFMRASSEWLSHRATDVSITAKYSLCSFHKILLTLHRY